MIEEIKLVDNPSKKYASLELEKELYLVTHPENWETEALQIQPNSEEQINFSIALENLDQTTNKPSNPGNAEDILKNTPNMKQSDFTIELGRRKETSLWTVQNIQVYYKNTLLLDPDTNGTTTTQDSGFMHVIINYEDKEKRIYTNTANDVRYIKKNQAYVGFIALPAKYIGLGLAQYIYQGIANKLGIEIVKWDTQSPASQKFRAKRTSFVPEKSTS